MYTTACTNIKGFLFAQTLLPQIGARITCFRLCMSVDSRETLGISFTEAMCLLRHLIQITRRRKKGINTLMRKWGENGRDWLKSASILNHLFLPEPTWTKTSHILEMTYDISKLQNIGPSFLWNRYQGVLHTNTLIYGARFRQEFRLDFLKKRGVLFHKISQTSE